MDNFEIVQDLIMAMDHLMNVAEETTDGPVLGAIQASISNVAEAIRIVTSRSWSVE